MNKTAIKKAIVAADNLVGQLLEKCGGLGSGVPGPCPSGHSDKPHESHGSGGSSSVSKPEAKPAKTTSLKSEPKTKTPPPPFNVDVDAKGPNGVTKTARVGVPGDQVPPLPPIGRLPNLTQKERNVETAWNKRCERNPDKMADQYLSKVKAGTKPGSPPVFETDGVKQLNSAWMHPNPTTRAKNRATLNTALHQTANAVCKRAFLKHLDTLKPGDEVLVTVGGCGCHEKDALIMLHEGTVIPVQDIQIGDLLMGPDSQPRRVLQLIRGRGEMVRVIPKKGRSFIVNEDHILSLQTNRVRGSKKRSKLCTVNMTVREVSNRGKSFVRVAYLYRKAVDFPTVPVVLDPYYLGIWLGNGTHTLPSVASKDNEVAEFIHEYATAFDGVHVSVRDKTPFEGYVDNLSKDYAIACDASGRANPVTDLLRAVGVLGNKHIPGEYLRNDRNTRLRLLAGLLDTDGSLSKGCFELTTQFERLAYDVAYLARSLGLAAYVKMRHMKTNVLKEARDYWRVLLSGDVDCIPTKVANKKATARKINKDALRVGFTLESVGQGDFYGFELEGDGLYLMDDFTVTHNSGKGYALGKVPEALEMKKRSKAVWDSAGDQNATENPWIQKELEKRGLKGNYLHVSADPKNQWADPNMGVIKRAGNPADGRMVDAKVFADSYAIGNKNHNAFHEANKNNKNANFIFIQNGKTPKKLDRIPEEGLQHDRHELAKFAIEAVASTNAPAHVKRGALTGTRIWEGGT